MIVSAWRRGLKAKSGVVAIGVVLVLEPGADPALAADEPVGVSAGDGRLLAEGAAVEIPVRYTCPQGWLGYISVELYQPVGRDRLIRGRGDMQQVSCTGGELAEDVFVVPGGKRARFQPGLAAVRATVNAGNPSPGPLEGGCLSAVGCPSSLGIGGAAEREGQGTFGGEVVLVD